MKGFWIMMANKAIFKVCDAVKHDIDDSTSRGEVPITVCILSGALVGGLLAGFAGAVVGGIAGAILKNTFKRKSTGMAY
jgi:outer membrane lipoprotein SlyB